MNKSMADPSRRDWNRLALCGGLFLLAGCSGPFSSSGEPEKIKGLPPGEYRDKMEEDQLEQAGKSKKSSKKAPR
ncbi:MAG: hypothetical protein U0790_14250 [Isosphaeraceae bacterium]